MESERKKLDERFHRRERLSLDHDFEAIFRAKRSAAGRVLVVYGRRNELGYNRLGLVVSARLGSAVTRARFKRLVREAFRRSKGEQPIGYDWLVLPRLPKRVPGKKGKPKGPALAFDWELIRTDWMELVTKLGRGAMRGSRDE